jgi:uncharacterized protein YeaO (DUF488 family)
MIMIESEGITENADPWRTHVPAEVINSLGLENVNFEAADPEVFAWYVKNYVPEVNLFVDHSQIVQLETLRRGIWAPRASGAASSPTRDSLMALRVKRVYEEPEPSDGERILVGRIWPRGISKDEARLSNWRRDLAPSNDLREWFGHDTDRWEEFRERYRAELEEAGKMGNLRDIAERAREANVTLLFGAMDTKHNNARALEAFVEEVQHQSQTRQRPEGRGVKRA